MCCSRWATRIATCCGAGTASSTSSACCPRSSAPAPTFLRRPTCRSRRWSTRVFGAYGVAPGAVLNSRSLGFNDNGTLFGQIGAHQLPGPDHRILQHGRRHRPAAGDLPGIRDQSDEAQVVLRQVRFQGRGLGDRVRPVPLQQDHGHRPGRLVADLVRRADDSRDQSVHSRGPRARSSRRVRRRARISRSTIASWGWTTANSRPTSPRGNTSSDSAATCRSRTGAGTSTVRTTPRTSSRRRTRRC